MTAMLAEQLKKRVDILDGYECAGIVARESLAEKAADDRSAPPAGHIGEALLLEHVVVEFLEPGLTTE
ncbi:hypothetical protein WI88_16100 [Burkholderia ubonensis]|nr:hypothetical protein WI88_16100 [Burkholderia ubonensis]